MLVSYSGTSLGAVAGRLTSHPETFSRSLKLVKDAVSLKHSATSRLGTAKRVLPSNVQHSVDDLGRSRTIRDLSTSRLADLLRAEKTETEQSFDPVTGDDQKMFDSLRAYQLVKSYQVRGFQFAKTDPLGLPKEKPFMSMAAFNDSGRHPNYKVYGFTDADLDREIDCRVPGFEGFLSSDREPITLRQLIRRLEETYCDRIGVEYMHISDNKIRDFLQKRVETPQKFSFSKNMRCRILIRTMRARMFETFCASKFPTTKRFGLDGCESMIVAMKEITKRASSQGVKNVVMGMAHRGRLNLLMNVMHKPMQQIVGEFRGLTGFGSNDWGTMGDVKYHLGLDFDHWDVDAERYIHMALLPNPSHLEAIDPLVLGTARAQQYFSGDNDKRMTLPIMIHGDVSIAGQGVVYEALQMSKLPAYDVGGTIHIVVNNQVGFTADPLDTGSGRHCSSIAKAVDAPIFHVNADDPEAVTFVAQVVFDYRQQFGGDVFINLVGYRRFGHNEMDLPKFTQPRMYNIIDKHEPVLELHAKRLMEEGVIDKKYFDDKKKETLDFYNAQYEESKTYDPSSKVLEYAPQWRHMARPSDNCPPRITGVPNEALVEVGRKISELPKNLTVHPTLGKLYAARVKALDTGEGVDFGFGEALAYGTLLRDGYHVRLVGQDCERGTFSHRHAVLHDQIDVARKYIPLQQLQTPHKFSIHNSLLSEYAALGFEVGYAMEHPDTLAIWEAQFGDFGNGAQIVIDQFIAAGEVKWGRQCGIVMLLPHGYDGMGPEHSSGRVERFLQLCDDREDVIHPENWDVDRRSVIQKHNIQVVVPSTPSQHFHVLRRQQIRGFRKPLVVFSPKKLLKLRSAVSKLSEFADNTKFQRYIPNVKSSKTPEDSTVSRLIVCTGQIYYDLEVQREKLSQWNVAIARVEQLSPFPFERFIDDVKRYPNLKDVFWVQEEPMNNGAWSYVSKRIESSLKHTGYPNGISKAVYVGRDVSGAPAVGDARLHQKEHDVIMRDAFDVNRSTNSHYEHYIKTS